MPLWDSPLFGLRELRYYDFDGDGTLDGGRENTRQPYCESWTTSMAPRPYTGGGFVCPITGNVEGPIEYESRPDGKTDLVGSVWSSSPQGPQLGPVRFTLVDGKYARDPANLPFRTERCRLICITAVFDCP